MRPVFYSLIAAVVLAAVAFASEAQAHGPRFSVSLGFGYPSYYGGYYGGYYGHGGHDVYPHWHRTYTPFGSYSWYGTGTHDFLPHHHSVTPFSYRGHHYTPWGYTESYYPRYPYYYAPW